MQLRIFFKCMPAQCRFDSNRNRCIGGVQPQKLNSQERGSWVTEVSNYAPRETISVPLLFKWNSHNCTTTCITLNQSTQNSFEPCRTKSLPDNFPGEPQVLRRTFWILVGHFSVNINILNVWSICQTVSFIYSHLSFIYPGRSNPFPGHFQNFWPDMSGELGEFHILWSLESSVVLEALTSCRSPCCPA